MWTCPDAFTSEQGGAPGFHSCGGQHKRNRIILQELLPSIDEYNEWSFCAVVTFSSHASWILGAKTRRESVHCKVCFTHVFWPNSIQFFCSRSAYVVVGVFKFLYLDKNVHVLHRILNEHKLQLIIFGSILNSTDIFESVTLHQMDVSVSFKPTDMTVSARSIENGGHLRFRHGVNNISHVFWSDVKLTTKFKFNFVTDADTFGSVHVMDQTDEYIDWLCCAPEMETYAKWFIWVFSV